MYRGLGEGAWRVLVLEAAGRTAVVASAAVGAVPITARRAFGRFGPAINPLTAFATGGFPPVSVTSRTFARRIAFGLGRFALSDGTADAQVRVGKFFAGTSDFIRQFAGAVFRVERQFVLAVQKSVGNLLPRLNAEDDGFLVFTRIEKINLENADAQQLVGIERFLAPWRASPDVFETNIFSASDEFEQFADVDWFAELLV